MKCFNNGRINNQFIFKNVDRLMEGWLTITWHFGVPTFSEYEASSLQSIHL